MVQLASSASLSNALALQEGIDARIRSNPAWSGVEASIVVHRKSKYFCNVILWPTSWAAPTRYSTKFMEAKSMVPKNQGIIRETSTYCPCWRKGTLELGGAKSLTVYDCDSAEECN